MKRTIKRIGLMMGAVLMITAAGAGSALAENQNTGKATASTSTESKDQRNKTTEQAKKTDKEESTLFYGRVKKIKKHKLVLDTASVVWEKADAVSDGRTAATETKSGTEIPADYVTETMKWKLDGKKLKIKTNKDTRYLMETVKNDIKKGDQDKPKDDQKDKKTASAGSDTGIQNIVINRKSIDKGMFVKVTVKAKADGTLIAQEVLLIAEAKSLKPDKGTKTNKAA